MRLGSLQTVGDHPRALRILVLAGYGLLGGTFLTAAVLSGGLFDILKGLHGSGGGSANVAGGAFTLAHSVGQPNARAMSGGAFQLDSGFHGPLQPVGLAPQLVAVLVPSGPVVDGVIVGVPLSAAVQLQFTQPMNAATLIPAASVTAVRDSSGNSIQVSVAVTLTYSAGTNSLSISPAAPWDVNTLFEIRVSTSAQSAAGVPLASAVVKGIQTVMDSSQPNTFADAGGGTQLVVAPLALLGGGFVVVNTDPMHDPDRVSPPVIQQADVKMASQPGGLLATSVLREINAYDAASNPIQLAAPNLARLTVPYADANGDGFVDGTFPQVRAKTLAIWLLDETRGLWVRIPSSSLDTVSRTVTASVPHLSVFALIGTQDTDVSQAYAYPVPWKPRAGNTARYGTLQGGITFTNLPSIGSVRIYTIAGELVNALDIPPGTLTLNWRGTNNSGEEVASGVYLWEIKSGDNRNTGKLMIVW